MSRNSGNMAKKKANSTSGKFKFRKDTNIGAPAAEEDGRFLETAFVDTGALDILRSKSRSECIVMGRSGAGKTALLAKLAEQEERVIKIAPESLALSYISENTSLRFFIELGLNLEPFYRLLWRHIFTVEIIR